MRLPASGTLAQRPQGQSGSRSVSRFQAAYGPVVFFACVLTLVVISWGSWVRVEGAGLACPDWPLCNGRVIPANDRLVLIEWSHRLVAAILGFAILFTAFGAWRWYRANRWVLVPGIASLVFVSIQIILGAITVTANLSPQVVSAHLGTSMLVFASLLVTAVGVGGWPHRSVAASLRAFPLAALFGAVMMYGLLLTGSYVVGSGASAACRSWPSCDGLPGAGDIVQVHMFHRVAVVFVGAVVAFTAWQAWRVRKAYPALAVVAAAGVVVYALQALVGAGNIWFALANWIQVAHVAMAAAMWAVMVLLATLAWRATRTAG
ncbi:MAG: heme A synthase [Dehalococcoidia bacterium]